MKYRVHELSRGARKDFEALLPHCALFKMPNEAGNENKSVVDAVAESREWRTGGVLPFPFTATEFSWTEKKNGVDKYTETVIGYIAKSGELMILLRLVLVLKAGPGVREDVTATVFSKYWVDHGDEPLSMVDPIDMDRHSVDTTSDDPKMQNYISFVAREGGAAISRLNYLVRALESVEHTTTKQRLSRNEARSLGVPREHWEITIRRKGSRNVPSAREQFAAVMKAAHAVRAHKREEHLRQYKSGHIAVVKPHIVRAHTRGKGGAVQLKDYRIT